MNKRKFLTVYLSSIFLLYLPIKSQDIKSDAVFEKITTTYTLQNDGSIRTEYYEKIKLLTSQAVSRLYGESSIFYNPKFQKLTIDKSETTMADGTLVPTPENGYNEVLPRFLHHAPGYAFLREMVVSHTGLERKSMVELKYHIDTKPEFLPWLMGEEIFGRSSPIKNQTVIVKIPQEKTLYYKILNSNLTPEIKKENGFIIYTWEFQNCAPLLEESNHQDFAEYTPRLLFSTCADWDQLIAYLKKSLQPKYTLSEKAQAVLLQNITDLASESRILSIQNKIAENISNTNLDISLLGYRSFSAQETFQKNHGTILDKAILLKSILSSQEFNADIALASHCEQFCKEVPSLSQFTEAWVIVSTEDDKHFILVPHKSQLSKGQIELAGKTLLGLGDEDRKLMQVHKLSPMENYVKVSGILTVDNELTVKGDITLSTSGTFYPNYTMKKDNQKNFLSRTINSILPNTEVEDFTVLHINEDRVEFTVAITNKSPFKKIGNSTLYESFSLNSVFDNWHISSSFFNRTTPLELTAPLNEHILLVLNNPENISLSSGVKNYDYSCDKGHIMYRISQRGNRIIMERQLTIKDKVITPTEYPDFRTILVNLQAEDHRSFMVEVD